MGLAAEIVACNDCARPRTPYEVLWFGDRYGSGRCEVCERAWSDRLIKWIRGEVVEPELERFFASPLVNPD